MLRLAMAISLKRVEKKDLKASYKLNIKAELHSIKLIPIVFHKFLSILNIKLKLLKTSDIVIHTIRFVP